MKRQNVRTLALIVVTFTYLLVGATIFDALESSYEENQKLEIESLQDEYMKKYNISSVDFEEIFKLVLKLKPLKVSTQWKFAGAFYFATTVITTIGYGHSTPKTKGGKIFCMVYALPGIPLTIVMFQSIGERMNIFITCILHFLQKKLMGKSSKISQTKVILISSNFVSLVIFLGALFFKYSENWTLFDSIYYCFITLTTIGFGDFVALQKHDNIAKRPDYVAFNLIFILFGLTVVSSVMNLLVLRFLTMNTVDECRDEIEAAVHAIDQNQKYVNQTVMTKGNDFYNSEYQSHSSGNPLAPREHGDSSTSIFSSLCFKSNSSKLWITSWKCIDRKNRCILTRNERYKSKSNFKSGMKNSIYWKIDSYQNHLDNQRKHYTVTRGPAVVRHLAESGFMRFYQCSPPAIKLDQIISESADSKYYHYDFQGKNISNLLDKDIFCDYYKNDLKPIAENYLRRHNTV